MNVFLTHVKRFLPIIISLILLIGVAATVYMVQKNQDARSRAARHTGENIYFEPNQITVHRNEEFHIDIKLMSIINNTSYQVTGAKFKLNLPSNQSVQTLSLLDGWIVNGGGMTLIEDPWILSGNAGMTAGSDCDSTHCTTFFQGLETLATIYMKALTPGTYQLNFDTASIEISANGQGSNNIASPGGPVTITVLDSATPSPTPLPSPGLVTTSFPNGTVNVPYVADVAVLGHTQNISTYLLNLPSGLTSLPGAIVDNGNGTFTKHTNVTGVPTNPGTLIVNISANIGGNTSLYTLPITILPTSSPSPTPSPLPGALKIHQILLSDDGTSLNYHTCDFINETPQNCVPENSWTNLRVFQVLSNDTSYRSYMAFVFNSGSIQKIRRVFVSSDGRRSFYQTCNFINGTVPPETCVPYLVPWTEIPLPTINGDSVYKSFMSFVFLDGATQKIRQALLNDAGTVTYYRTCDFTNETFQNCNPSSGWNTQNLSEIINKDSSYRSFMSFVFMNGATQRIRQVFVSSDGRNGYLRTCNFLNGAIQLETCNPRDDWSTVALPNTISGNTFRSFMSFTY